MRSNKPALVLSNTFELWLGNTSDTQLQVDPGELFGFSTGSYEEVTVASHLAFFLFNVKQDVFGQVSTQSLFDFSSFAFQSIVS